MVDQLLSETIIFKTVLLQWIQVGNGDVEQLEKEFLLKLLEKTHLYGCNVFPIGWNGRLFAVGALDGDGFISRLKMCLQFGQPHVNEMKSWCIEQLEGLAASLK